MGICYSEPSHNTKPTNSKPLSIEHFSNTSLMVKNDKSLITITNKTNEIIIKTIRQINGSCLSIENNKKCVIFILDYTLKATITNCMECSIFIAPCSTDIQISNCKSLNVISASANVIVNNVHTGNFFLFSKTPPLIQQSTHISLGIFCLQYTELPDMFRKANLNIWTNSWSQYILKPTASQSGSNSVTFINDDTKRAILKSFNTGRNDIIISFDQYQSHPYQLGKSISDRELYAMSNLLLIFKEDFINDNFKEVLNVLSPDEIREKGTMLIKTNVIAEARREFVVLREKVRNSGNDYLIGYFNSVGNASMGKMGRSCEKGIEDGSCKQLGKGEVLVMWLVNGLDMFEEFQRYIEGSFDNNSIGWIIADDLQCDEGSFQVLIKGIVY